MKRHLRWPILLLTIVLVAWEPLTFALYASSVVDRLVDRGVLAVAMLLARLLVTAVGIAAGLALWNQRPWSVRFAVVALLLSAAATIANALTGALPSNVQPGLSCPLLAARLSWNAGWIVYLTYLARRASVASA